MKNSGAAKRNCGPTAFGNSSFRNVGAAIGRPLRLLKNHVIARQCAHCRGNPPDFQTSTLGNLGFYAYPGDCHTSDIGHWFAMTLYILAMLTHRGT